LLISSQSAINLIYSDNKIAAFEKEATSEELNKQTHTKRGANSSRKYHFHAITKSIKEFHAILLALSLRFSSLKNLMFFRIFDFERINTIFETFITKIFVYDAGADQDFR
jgi:hypothetical protein